MPNQVTCTCRLLVCVRASYLIQHAGGITYVLRPSTVSLQPSLNTILWEKLKYCLWELDLILLSLDCIMKANFPLVGTLRYVHMH